MNETDFKECRNRLIRIIENAEDHLQTNSTKEDAVQHLMLIAKGISH